DVAGGVLPPLRRRHGGDDRLGLHPEAHDVEAVRDRRRRAVVLGRVEMGFLVALVLPGRGRSGAGGALLVAFADHGHRLLAVEPDAGQVRAELGLLGGRDRAGGAAGGGRAGEGGVERAQVVVGARGQHGTLEQPGLELHTAPGVGLAELVVDRSLEREAGRRREELRLGLDVEPFRPGVVGVEVDDVGHVDPGGLQHAGLAAVAAVGVLAPGLVGVVLALVGTALLGGFGPEADDLAAGRQADLVAGAAAAGGVGLAQVVVVDVAGVAARLHLRQDLAVDEGPGDRDAGAGGQRAGV